MTHLRDRAFVWACLYLTALFVSVIVLWWVALIGGNPFNVVSTVAVNHAGEHVRTFKAGEVVGVISEVCSDENIGAKMHPSLQNEKGLVMPLKPISIYFNRGCQSTDYGFIIPDIPTGRYDYKNVVVFQNNLVGRDEYVQFHKVAIEVVK